MESTTVESQEPLLHVPTKPRLLTGSERPYRDSIFTFLFVTTVLTTFTLGILASSHTDTLNLDTRLRLSHFNPTTNTCEITPHRKLPEDPDSNSAVVTLVAIAFCTSLALTSLLSLLLVSLLRRYTRPLVLVSASITALVPLLACVFWFSPYLCVLVEDCATMRPVSKQILYAVVLPGGSALFVYQLWKDWKESAFDKGVQSLRLATGFWKEHFVLLVVNSVLMMGWMMVVNGPIFVFMWYAFNVGEIVPNFHVVNDPMKDCGLASTESPCCREERPGWVYAYIVFASCTALWVLWVSLTLQHLVESGTVSRWYFAPTGSSPIGNIKRSLRNAYGPSFGTACNKGTLVTCFVVGLVGSLKQLGDRVLKNSSRQGMMPSNHRLPHGCFSQMSQFPECHPQYSSIFASISGDSFWKSSKKSHNLLIRTSLVSTNGTCFHLSALETLARMTFICTLLQTLVVYAVLEYFPNADFDTKFVIVFLCFLIPMIWLGTGFFYSRSFCVFHGVYVLCNREGRWGDFKARALSSTPGPSTTFIA